MNPKKYQAQDQCLHEPDAAVSLLRMGADNCNDG